MIARKKMLPGFIMVEVLVSVMILAVVFSMFLRVMSSKGLRVNQNSWKLRVSMVLQDRLHVFLSGEQEERETDSDFKLSFQRKSVSEQSSLAVFKEKFEVVKATASSQNDDFSELFFFSIAPKQEQGDSPKGSLS
jgi:Tfp pilus assembly protein PilV